MQALGGFLVYFTVYAQQGFWPTSLINLRVAWETDDINDLEDSYGQEWVSQEFLGQHHLVLLLSSRCPPILSQKPTFLKVIDEADLAASRLQSPEDPR